MYVCASCECVLCECVCQEKKEKKEQTYECQCSPSENSSHSSLSRLGNVASGHSMSCQPSRARKRSHSSWVTGAGSLETRISCLGRLAVGTSEVEEEMQEGDGALSGEELGEMQTVVVLLEGEGTLFAGLRLRLRHRLREGGV